MADHRLVVPVYPWQRVARTVVLDVVVWGPVTLAAVPQVVEASRILVTGGVVSAAVYAKLAAVAGTATVVRAALVRIIALPTIDRLLSAIGLGTVPRRVRGQVETVKGTRQARAAISASSDPDR